MNSRVCKHSNSSASCGNVGLSLPHIQLPTCQSTSLSGTSAVRRTASSVPTGLSNRKLAGYPNKTICITHTGTQVYDITSHRLCGRASVQQAILLQRGLEVYTFNSTKSGESEKNKTQNTKMFGIDLEITDSLPTGHGGDQRPRH